MDTKIFEEPLNLEKVEAVINDYIAKEVLNLQSSDLLEKWNVFPIIFLEEEETITKVVESIAYIDALSLEKKTKIHYVLTLCYLIIKEKLEITSMDINNIFLLVSYLDKLPLEKLKNSLQYLNNESLLLKIRFKTLDITIREELIEYLDKARKSIKDAIQFIEKTEYYELLKTIES